VGAGSRIRKAWKAAALIGVGAAGGGAALAVASVPDSSGVIHACYPITEINGTTRPVATANLRVIDPSAGQTCTAFNTDVSSGEAALSWNQTGPSGPQGAPGATGATEPTGPTGPQGAPGTNTTVLSGNTLTLSGGQVITIGAGNGLTINTPPVKPTAPAIGHVKLGGLSFNILAYDVAPTGAGAGKVKFNEFVFSKKTDSASPLLFKACATGKHFPTVTITLARKAGENPKEYLKITLTEVVITAVLSQSSGPSGEAPTESLSLNFTKIAYKYPQK
jgi:type VI protein secretion system component Hcp